MKQQQRERPEWVRALGAATGAGFTLLSCILLGVFLGRKADTYFNIGPWGLLCGSLLGGVTGLYSLYKQMTEKS